MKLSEISYGMSEMARTHPNDMISNNLARVSEKVASLGLAWSPKLDETDLMVIRYYLKTKVDIPTESV
jgi:hypothetical protein